MFHEFYAFYEATVNNSLPLRAKDLDHPLLLTTLVGFIPIDISKETILFMS